jgi:hypothetical protein
MNAGEAEFMMDAVDLPCIARSTQIHISADRCRTAVAFSHPRLFISYAAPWLDHG